MARFAVCFADFDDWVVLLDEVSFWTGFYFLVWEKSEFVKLVGRRVTGENKVTKC